MDTSRLLFLFVMVITAAECSETDEPPCYESDIEKFSLLEGEAFYFVPFDLSHLNFSDNDFTWYKNASKTESISNDEKEMVHYHGHALLFLNLQAENSGIYTARRTQPSGECYNYHLQVEVLKKQNDSALIYEEIKNSDQNKKIPCPDRVHLTCTLLKGELTWHKHWLQDVIFPDVDNEANLWILNATKDNEGVYNCYCTWTHNHQKYISSGSRRLKVEDSVAHRKPEIISGNRETFADEGFGIKLNCTVFCGTNVSPRCDAWWNLSKIAFSPTDGYNQATKMVIDEHSKNTFSTAILTIEKVSAKDFKTEFQCIGKGLYERTSFSVTLKRRETIIPLVIGGGCVLLFCAFAAMLVKFFAIDLALFFRRCFPSSSHNKDPKVFDAYVVYQTQNLDKVTEESLCQFVTKHLPSVLEEKCGYRLYIHGRDDIPGEDRLEVVENRLKLSRRLMVILTPGLGSGSEITDQCLASPKNTEMEGFDWQVGLHHALVQREMSVIMIQLGETEPQGYTHLLPGLQHLIRKSAPIRWPEGSRGDAAWNSRFWKRVRYLMPAHPAKKYSQSAII